MNESEELAAASQSADMLADSIRRMFRARLDMTMPAGGHWHSHQAIVIVLGQLVEDARKLAATLHTLAD